MIEVTFKSQFIPVDFAMKLFGLSRSYLYKLRQKGKINHYHVGARTFVSITEIEALIAKSIDKNFESEAKKPAPTQEPILDKALQDGFKEMAEAFEIIENIIICHACNNPAYKLPPDADRLTELRFKALKDKPILHFCRDCKSYLQRNDGGTMPNIQPIIDSGNYELLAAEILVRKINNYGKNKKRRRPASRSTDSVQPIESRQDGIKGGQTSGVNG
jgi:hypothetical protein